MDITLNYLHNKKNIRPSIYVISFHDEKITLRNSFYRPYKVIESFSFLSVRRLISLYKYSNEGEENMNNLCDAPFSLHTYVQR